MPHRIRHINHWRPLHDPWTFTADGQYPERLTPTDRRHLKRRVRRLLRRLEATDGAGCFGEHHGRLTARDRPSRAPPD